MAEDLEPLLDRALRMCMPPFRAADLPEWNAEETPGGLVATVTVKPTPYELSVAGEAVFVRSGTLNVRLSPSQQTRGAHGRAALFYEDDPVPGASVEDFDDAVLEEYRLNRIKRGPRGESFTRQELLRDAGAVDAGGAPTVAGLLLFGRAPEQFLPQAGVVVVRFKGTSLREAAVSGERYSRRVEIGGPAPRLVEKTWEVLFEETHLQAYLKGWYARSVTNIRWRRCARRWSTPSATAITPSPASASRSASSTIAWRSCPRAASPATSLWRTCSMSTIRATRGWCAACTTGATSKNWARAWTLSMTPCAASTTAARVP